MHRETWIDSAKGVAILLVVLGHAIRGISSADFPVHSIWLELDILIYAFHMPLFFALSGWFYVRSIANRAFVSFTTNRLERIFYPMVLWTYIFFACKFLAGEYANNPIAAAEFPLIPIPGVLHFWFLWDLLILSFAAYPLSFAFRNDRIVPSVWLLVALIVIILRFVPLSETAIPWFGSAIYNAPFFLFGVVLGQIKDPVNLGACGLVALAAIFVVVLAMWPNLAHPALRDGGSFVLVLCLLALLRGIALRLPARLDSTLTALGIASMTIYVAHTIFSATFREVLISFAVTDPSTLILLGTIVGVLGPLVLLVIARYFGISRILGLEVRVVRLKNS